MIDSLWFLLTYNLSPHHTSKNSTSPIGSDSEIRQYPGTLVGWLVALVAESRIYLGVPRGHCCGPKSWCFFLPKTSMIRWKKWAFLGGICFFSLKRATKNIWYSTGCYCNVFVHTSLGRQSSKTSANQWRWIRLPGRFPWKFGNTQNRKVRFCSFFLNQ